MTSRAHTPNLFSATAIIALALCVMIYHQAATLAPLHPHTALTFLAPRNHFHFEGFKSSLGVMDLRRAWTPRILSLWLGYAFTRDAIEGNAAVADRFAHKTGLYVAFWMGLTLMLYLLTLRERALLPILATYCAVNFAYLPGAADRVYPWDMPALFFYTLFVCLMLRRRQLFFLPLLPLAVLFKETAGLLALGYLFGPWPLRRRVRLFLIAAGLAGLARVGVLAATHTFGDVPFKWALLAANLRYCLTGTFPYPDWYRYPLMRINHPLLINAGLFAAFILVPTRDVNGRALRWIFYTFTALMLCGGIIFEYRIWFELIPICLYPLCLQAPTPETAQNS